MPLYESVFIARQDVSGPQVESLSEDLQNIIRENGGSIEKSEYWGLRNLAYRINKNRKGHYVLLNVDAPPVAVQEMERNMRINEDVIRYMTIRVDELDPNPSLMTQTRSAREGSRREHRDRGEGREARPSAPAAEEEAGSSAAPAGRGEKTEPGES